MKSQQEMNIYNCEYRAKHATRYISYMYDASNKLMLVGGPLVLHLCVVVPRLLSAAYAYSSLSVPSRKSTIWPFE